MRDYRVNGKNICFFIGDISKSGGTERVTSEIANELCKLKNKYRVTILSLNKDNEANFFKLDNLVIDDYLFYKRKVNAKKDYIKIVSKLRNYIKENNIDVLIDVDTILDVFSIPATRFTKTKFIAWEHFNFYENLGVKFRDLGRKLSARYADCIVTITEEDLGYFKENLNIRNKIVNIYNPITLKNVDDISYSSDSKIIISAGRLTYQKGFDMLVEVAKRVFEVHPSWKWYLLGEGEDRKLIEDKIKEYSLENNIILMGNVKDIENYYKKASMFVLTSRFEGLGMVILEAMNYKLPVVSFACKVGPKEMIADNVNGFLIEEKNIEGMHNKICKLIENKQIRNDFSKNSNINLDKFNKKKICDEWDKLISSL